MVQLILVHTLLGQARLFFLFFSIFFSHFLSLSYQARLGHFFYFFIGQVVQDYCRIQKKIFPRLGHLLFCIYIGRLGQVIFQSIHSKARQFLFFVYITSFVLQRPSSDLQYAKASFAQSGNRLKTGLVFCKIQIKVAYKLEIF